MEAAAGEKIIIIKIIIITETATEIVEGQEPSFLRFFFLSSFFLLIQFSMLLQGVKLSRPFHL
jgi:hypothetical protein